MSRKQQFKITLQDDILEIFEHTANVENLTFSEIIDRLIRERLKEKNEKQSLPKFTKTTWTEKSNKPYWDQVNEMKQYDPEISLMYYYHTCPLKEKEKIAQVYPTIAQKYESHWRLNLLEFQAVDCERIWKETPDLSKSINQMLKECEGIVLSKDSIIFSEPIYSVKMEKWLFKVGYETTPHVIERTGKFSKYPFTLKVRKILDSAPDLPSPLVQDCEILNK